MSDSNDKRWFDKIRVNSWEVEILIVAVILAFLFQIPDFISVKLAALEVSNHHDSRAYHPVNSNTPFWFILGFVKMIILSLVKSCFGIAKITFCSYVFFRGFWVAVIGLSSVFTKGIDIKKLNYSKYFNRVLARDDFDSLILKLDNICSSIFSLGFLIAFYVSSIMIYLSFTLLFIGSFEYLFNSLNPSEWMLSSMLILFLTIGAIFFIDIIFFGILKKVKWKVFSYPYSKIYNLLRIVTGFFLYEAVYFLFISNISRKSVFILFLFLALFISASILSNKSDGYLAFPADTLETDSFMSQNHYEDRLLASGNNFSFTKYPFINSEIISESFLKLYMPFHANIHSSIDSACGIVNSDKGSSYYQSLINCINSQYAIYIDNDTIVSDFVFYDYSSNDISIKTFFMPIPVKNYQEGKHIIIIEKLFYEYYNYIEDSVATSKYHIDKNLKVELMKNSDSLIHIPFYIYR